MEPGKIEFVRVNRKSRFAHVERAIGCVRILGFAFTHWLRDSMQSITSISFIWYFSGIDLACARDFIQPGNYIPVRETFIPYNVYVPLYIHISLH